MSKKLAKTSTIVGLSVPAELAERLQTKYQDRQLDKLTTMVTARQGHVDKITKLKKRFNEISAGTSETENIEALSPKLRDLLADRVMAKHEDELLDLLEDINREQRAIKKIDDNFDGITELL